MNPKITKNTISKSTRLSNIEAEMALHILNQDDDLDLISLKQKFPRRASLATIKSIAKASPLFNENAEKITIDMATVNQDRYLANISYHMSGTGIVSFKVGGKDGYIGDGIATDIQIFRNRFFVTVIRTGTGLDRWTFKTKEVIISDGTIKKGKPETMESIRKTENIKVI